MAKGFLKKIFSSKEVEPLSSLAEGDVHLPQKTDLEVGADSADVSSELDKKGVLRRLGEGLVRSSTALKQGLSQLFTHQKLDENLLESIEETLIQADLPLSLVDRLMEQLRRRRYEADIDLADVQALLAHEIESILKPVAQRLEIPDTSFGPFVVLVVGVNGAGKTTTIGKLATEWSQEGKKVLLVAGDTFRAAATEQLTIWAERSSSHIITKPPGSDAAALAFEALRAAADDMYDIVLMDTAGRLHNRGELMDELRKIIRIMRKINPDFPHLVLLVLDATTGQNVLNQVEIFAKLSERVGLIMTKLDGTARGGILVAVAETFGLPIHYIGIGEHASALEKFDAAVFAQALTGLKVK